MLKLIEKEIVNVRLELQELDAVWLSTAIPGRNFLRPLMVTPMAI
jgi:hypothetical protein